MHRPAAVILALAVFLCAVVLLCSPGRTPQTDNPTPTEEAAAPTESVTPSPSPSPTPAAPRFTAEHIAYLAGETAIDPDSTVTVEEAARVLAAVTQTGAPVPELSGSPASSVTRSEYAQALAAYANCAEGFSASVTRPYDILTLAELCVLTNQASGRSSDAACALACGLTEKYPALSVTHWAYADIAEALTEHEYTLTAQGQEQWLMSGLESGVYRDNSRFVLVDESGELVRSRTEGFFTFDDTGRYTTGDAELDACLDAVLAECSTGELDSYEALQTVYLFIKNNAEYIRRPAEDNLEYNASGWENDWAKTFFADEYKGNCYSFAAAFGLLARALGYEAYIVSGEINQYYEAHGFVVIPTDGVDRIFDVEMEYARPERHEDLGLFDIENHAIYHYWYDPYW